MKVPFLPFRSIRQKLVAGVLLTSLVALLVSGVSLFVYDLNNHRESSAADLQSQAELLGSATTVALEFDDAALAEHDLSYLRVRPALRGAAVYNSRGNVFAKYVRPGVLASELPIAAGPDGVAIVGDRITVFHRIVANGARVGTVYLDADLGMRKRIVAYAESALAVMLAALLVSSLLSRWLQAGITMPIIGISELAREVVTKRDYSVRAQRTTQDEIGTLAEAFNEMLSEIERRTRDLEASSAEISRLNRDLEKRVADRTAQLEESNAQLKAANAAKSSFLSTMSHEIRTPMNGVLGMLELLSLSDLDTQQRNTLGIVRESGRSLLRIIDDILDFSKIEAGKLEIRPQPASVAGVIASVVGIYSGNASSKGLLLHSAVDSRISPAVLVDPLRLQQILNNFVSNAIKFTSKGAIHIRAELIDRGEAHDVVRFSVADTGMGMSPEAQALVFQPFAQADADIARVFGGTGLGLSICQRLARLMGASIEVESQLGTGTTLMLTVPLPIADPGALPKVTAEASHKGSEQRTRVARTPLSVSDAESEGTLVLLADDHPINRLVLVRQVTALGYTSEAAEDGRQALKMWSSGRFRLLITDCNMPLMDGYALAREIRARELAEHGVRTTIIACTANALRGDAEQCFAAGMDDYISKPVQLVELRQKLDRWLPISGAGDDPVAAAVRAQAGRAPIEISVLAEASGHDSLLEREILAQFRSTHEEDATALERALETHDIALVTRAAHRIKGASSTIGASALADVCARLEGAGRLADWEAVVAAMEDYRRERYRVTACIGVLID